MFLIGMSDPVCLESNLFKKNCPLLGRHIIDVISKRITTDELIPVFIFPIANIVFFNRNFLS